MSRPPITVGVAEINLSPTSAYGWRVESHCGIVRAFSTRDGCMFAMAPSEAREVAAQFAAAMNTAADLTELRSFGEIVSGPGGHLPTPGGSS